MNSIDTIIIGGGISGLYHGYQLYKQKIPFVILEKNYNRRGRLYSLGFESPNNFINQPNSENNIIELGASIIHKNQVNMMKLIKELKLEDEIEELSTKQKSYLVYKSQPSDEIKKKWKKLKQHVKSKVDSFPDNLTVEELVRELMTEEEFNFFSTCWPEWYEVNLQNAKIFFKQEDEEGDYCKFKNGIETLVTKLTEILHPYIYFGCFVNKIKLNELENYYEITLEHHDEENQQYPFSNSSRGLSETREVKQVNIKSEPEKFTITSPKIFLAVDYTCAIKCIKYENLNEIKNYLECGFPRCCYRFYVYLKNPLNLTVNGGEIGSIVGDFQAKWTIKMNDHLWMISYVDGPLSCKLNKVKPKQLINNWIKMINKEFKFNLSFKDVLFYKAGFWQEAYSVLDKSFYYKINGQNYGEICRNLLPPGCQVAILPKNQGQDTSWIESVLL